MFRFFHGVATVGNSMMCLGSLATGSFAMAAIQGAISAWLISQQLKW
jgi:hypothetical protein